ncbi:DUF1990 domain-containing protein [Kitasatospora sp. RG8]|uniref:DUF1990 family protein n=1 Tax=Kitasatospora sp. RG8 TaxID=2820815 RepID=UPI0027DBAEA4|nr:DUF1990 domain-containing protein [Kitasatospora sp. RG8]
MPADLAQILASARAASPNYPEVGATLGPRLPAGYAQLRRRIHLGHGRAVLERAGRYVLGWGCQLGTGFAVHPYAPAEEGATVLLRLSPPRLRWPRVVIPCRVVWTVDEPDRIGFAYGTLPGHPECGEEAFLVSMDAAGEVWFEVTAFARLAAWYARLGRPVAVLCQYLAIEGYLAAVATAAIGPDDPTEPVRAATPAEPVHPGGAAAPTGLADPVHPADDHAAPAEPADPGGAAAAG